MGPIVNSRRAQASLVQGIAAAALAIACLLPLVTVAMTVFSQDTSQAPNGTIAQALHSTLGQARLWVLLAKSLGLALASTAIALLLGVPLGALLGRTNVAGRRLAFLIHAFPLFLPPFLLALGWLHIFGQQGILGSVATSRMLFGPVGVTLTLGLAFAPIMTALTALGLQGIDPSLEEAARTVSPPRRVMTRILLPLALPSIALATLAVFSLALSEIGVPMFFGVRTYPAAVFTRLGGFQYAPGEAVLLAIPLLVVALGLVALDHQWLRRGSFAALGSRSHQLQPLVLGRWRGAVTLGVWLVCLLPLTPVAIITVRAMEGGISDSIPWIRESLRTSLSISAMAATSITVVGLVIGHRLARGARTAAVLDGAAMFSFLVPSSVLGVGLVITWNRPSTQFIYTTSAILVLGLSARYLFLGIRTLGAVFHQSSPSYEEAAMTTGAGYLRRMTHIVVPIHWRGIAFTWLIVMVFCLRDLDTVIAFYPPGLEPLPVRIFTLEANGSETVIAGLATTHILLTAAVLVVGGALFRRRHP